ncbi:MAG: hypothetical protein V4555_12930 [Acidobacteriota bacterium]
MNTSVELDYVVIQDANGKPVKRPRNKLYEQVAAIQQRQKSGQEWPPLIEIQGEPLSETIIRERRGDFD